MTFAAIHRTLSTLDTLQRQVLTQNVFLVLQELLEVLKAAIEEIKVALKIDKFKQYQTKIKLCASQLTKALPILVDIVKGAQTSAHKEVTDFLIEKIKWCLLEVLRLFGGGGSENDGEPSGMFVKMMDDVLSTLQKEGNIDCSFRKTIDELLCQALTIAKLSALEDHESITAGCKNVLAALSDFTDFSRSPTNSFKIDALHSALEAVERKVNLAVLRLFLRLAADPNLPLKQLTLKALDKRHKPRNPCDLTADLDLLDLYCEQIQLIGNFAVACSNDSQLKVKILCCLASIEFCENFFGPSAEEFYMAPSDYNKKGFFKFIVDEYQKEMKELTKLIDCVVDTETFIQVAMGDLSPMVEDIKISVKNSIFNKRDAEVFLSRSVRVLKHLNSMKDESIATNSDRLITARKEYETALANYQSRLRANILDLRSMQDLLNRMDSALYSIQKISYLFSTIHADMLNTPSNKMRLRKTTFASNVTFTTSDSGILKPYLARVRETPRMKSSLYVVTPKKTPRSHPANINNYTITNISEVLENIRDFPDTFSSQASMKVALDNEDEADSQSPVDPDYLSLAASHSSLDTMGRIEDILLLDSKINKLKIV